MHMVGENHFMKIEADMWVDSINSEVKQHFTEADVMEHLTYPFMDALNKWGLPWQEDL